MTKVAKGKDVTAPQKDVAKEKIGEMTEEVAVTALLLAGAHHHVETRGQVIMAGLHRPHAVLSTTAAAAARPAASLIWHPGAIHMKETVETGSHPQGGPSQLATRRKETLGVVLTADRLRLMVAAVVAAIAAVGAVAAVAVPTQVKMSTATSTRVSAQSPPRELQPGVVAEIPMRVVLHTTGPRRGWGLQPDADRGFAAFSGLRDVVFGLL